MAKFNTAPFDTVARIDCEVSAVLASWPDETNFDARKALEHNPQLGNHLRALTAFAVEEFAILIENGEHPTVREFSAKFPEVRSDLESRLFNLLSLEASNPLLTDAPEAEFPRSGQKIGNFHLAEQLGVGAFSRVYLAFDTMMGSRRVVVKVTRRPADECRLAGPLNHPHIAKMFSVSVDEETGFTIVCMPYCGRLTCDDLREINPFAYKSYAKPDGAGPAEQQAEEDTASSPVEFLETALSIVCSIGDGIGHMHKRGIIHRDIKPSNIVLSNEMYPTLVDFNASSTFSNPAGVVVGTLPYVAPEILDGIRSGGLSAETLSPSADIYALGLVCYEMLAGVLPFDIAKFAEEDRVTVDSIRRAQLGEWTPLRDRNPLVSKRLSDVIAQATAQTAERRFEDVQDFCKCIRSELSPLQKLRRRIRAHSRVAIAGGSVVSILAATALASAITADDPSNGIKAKRDFIINTPVDEQFINPEITAYEILKSTNGRKDRAFVRKALLEVTGILGGIEQTGNLSAESYNNLGYALMYLDAAELPNAAPLLLKSTRMLPNHPVVLENQITCEFLLSYRKEYSPNVKPFIRHLSSELIEKPSLDPGVMALGAYCLLRSAERDTEPNLMMGHARLAATRAIESASRDHELTLYLRMFQDADSTTADSVNTLEFGRKVVRRRATILAPLQATHVAQHSGHAAP